jgi:CheY-like chemotaxis protein
LSGRRQDGRVLLVEDNDDNADLITRAFHKTGFPVTLERVTDGDAAVSRLNDPALRSVTLILLDLKLPLRSGFEVLTWARGEAGAAVRRIPIVVLTSSDQERDIRRAYDLGANSYLVKPVGAPALVEMARSLNGYWLRLNRGANPVGACDLRLRRHEPHHFAPFRTSAGGAIERVARPHWPGRPSSRKNRLGWRQFARIQAPLGAWRYRERDALGGDAGRGTLHL